MKNNVILEGKTRIGKHWIEANGSDHFIQKVFPMYLKTAPLFMALSIQTGERIVVSTEKDKHFNIKFL